MSEMLKKLNLKHKLIVSIVKKGVAKKIVKASKQAGAEGGTILYAKGTGVHENKTFLGIAVEPEKEVILTLVPTEKVEDVLNKIVEAGKLDKPGNGVGFVINTKGVGGICHLLAMQAKNSDEV